MFSSLQWKKSCFQDWKELACPGYSTRKVRFSTIHCTMMALVFFSLASGLLHIPVCVHARYVWICFSSWVLVHGIFSQETHIRGYTVGLKSIFLLIWMAGRIWDGWYSKEMRKVILQIVYCCGIFSHLFWWEKSGITATLFCCHGRFLLWTQHMKHNFQCIYIRKGNWVQIVGIQYV